jgi:hypothetical protein
MWKEGAYFHRFGADLKFLISYDFVHVGQENPAPTRVQEGRLLSGCHQIDWLPLYLFASSSPPPFQLRFPWPVFLVTVEDKSFKRMGIHSA